MEENRVGKNVILTLFRLLTEFRKERSFNRTLDNISKSHTCTANNLSHIRSTVLKHCKALTLKYKERFVLRLKAACVCVLTVSNINVRLKVISR